ncbi:alkaline phosphatase family protein [Rothia sp. ZJ1223]|uniref:alkaline phosphatase family protein n=1 Tax=Rothia sp. ZJ1223 TaxID=2811098 RepID=UPI00195CFE5C|nr:nucleotide pyrophosphatase/phosphodiesterase family protein [Rothia sp. ZJ1223]MBM7050704.1 alkaline phosphatase family protein [Rothia sp. ZJ1223]
MSFSDFRGTPVPTHPGYGAHNIADLFESAGTLVAQGSITPDEHPVLGTGRHDLLNLRQRLADAGLNPDAYRSVCVVMVDGLGEQLLRRYGSYAPYLKKAISLGPLNSAVPSTTAASLTSFGTALAPGTHGIAGYDVRNPEKNEIMNQLSGWDKSVDPHQWQPYPTVFERFENHCEVATVTLSKYQGTGLSEAGLRGGRFIHAQGAAARVTLGHSILSARKPALVYLYWAEIDQVGHRYGADSPQWSEQLEELNLHMRRLAERLPAHTLLLLTADHGMVDIPEEHRLDYSERTNLLENVELTGGEPRMVQLYLKDASATAKRATLEAWDAAYGDIAWIIDTETAFEAGYFGDHLSDEARARIGDILIACREDYALYDMRHYKPHALKMVGQHGSLTEAETQVPLLVLPTH